jgi:hypothetical protein
MFMFRIIVLRGCFLGLCRLGATYQQTRCDK